MLLNQGCWWVLGTALNRRCFRMRVFLAPVREKGLGIVCNVTGLGWRATAATTSWKLTGLLFWVLLGQAAEATATFPLALTQELTGGRAR